jgi:hypothetical protein
MKQFAVLRVGDCVQLAGEPLLEQEQGPVDGREDSAADEEVADMDD